MTTIAFIGLGNMGNPMAANLVKAGHQVRGYDLVTDNLAVAKENGVTIMANAAAAVKDADVVVTMLPAGKHVIAVYQDVVAGARACHHVLVDRDHVFARRQHGDDHVRVLHRGRRVGHDGDAVFLGHRQIVGHQVVAADLMTGLDEIGGHRVAHIAEADEGDGGHVGVSSGNAKCG